MRQELHSLTEQATAAAALLASLKEVLAADAEEALALDAVEGETGLGEAIQAAALRAHGLKAEAEANKAVARRFLEVAQRKEGHAGRLRTAIMTALQQAGLRRSPDGMARIDDKAPSVVVQDENRIPTEYFKSVLDKAKLRQAIAEGHQVPGTARGNDTVKLVLRKRVAAG